MNLLGRTKKEVVTEFRCTEILEAAKQVFARKGFHDATMDDVAEQAGVAKGTLYLYFRSKREIFVESLRQGFITLHEETCRRMDLAETTPEKLRAFIETRMDFTDTNRPFFRLYYTEFSNLLASPSVIRPEFQDLYEQQAALLSEVLAAGMERGEIRSRNLPALTRVVYDTIRGAIAQRILGWSPKASQEDADFVFEILWRGIGCN
jgi:AcrR family transcriptional regulator